MQIYTCNGGTNQQWTLNANGTLTILRSGLCVGVTASGTANGTLIQLAVCNGSAGQRWQRS